MVYPPDLISSCNGNVSERNQPPFKITRLYYITEAEGHAWEKASKGKLDIKWMAGVPAQKLYLPSCVALVSESYVNLQITLP